MAGLSLLPVFYREILGYPEFFREPEPDLIMEDLDQVAAYEKGGRDEGVMFASYLFHAARISLVIKGCKKVIDLACGPASQLSLVAELNPDISFLGIDYSETMLESGKKFIQKNNVTNVEFQKGDITNLAAIPDNGFDGVISSMAMHHLPSQLHLKKCFGEIKRVLKPEGKLYLVDFGRLKSLKSVLYFAHMNRKHQPPIFSLDYERSLRAAFSLADYEALKAQFFNEYQLFTTFLVPLLVIIKSEDAKIDSVTANKLNHKRKSLAPKYRKILDDMRLFFKLGKLKNDPFTRF